MKDVKIWVHKKTLKNPMKKRFSIKRPKFKNWVVVKLKGYKKPN